MSDSYVVNRLFTWAKVASRAEDGGLGYPKQSAFTNTMPHGGIKNYTPEINEGFLEVDACVIALSLHSEELYTAIFLHYRRNDLKVDEKVAMMGCTKKTFYNKIDRAHQLILGWLNDQAAGIRLPSYEDNMIRLKKIA